MGQDQKRAFTAVLLSGLILFGWQYFYGPSQSTVTSQTASRTKDSQNTQDGLKSESFAISNVTVSDKLETKSLSYVTLENDKNSYTLSSQLTLANAEFKETASKMSSFFSEKSNRIEFLVNESYRPLDFDLSKISSTELEFVHSDSGISGRAVLDISGFLNIHISRESRPFSYRFVLIEKPDEESSGGLFAVDISASKKKYAYFTNEYEILDISSDERGEGAFKWISLDKDYHLFANVFQEKSPLVFRSSLSKGFQVTSPDSTSHLSYQQIFVRKEYDTLGSLGHNLQQSIDFGMWAIIAIPILRGLQFFYSVFPNYGISIILLTILIRMLTFPLQFKSFKSMKKMQEIQPELTRLREKYKSDPQKMQQETMALFKRAGANPLGGCLPLLLQMPVFFAFYKVLYSSVELVNAPFFLWITDLSVKDPYYVLPVLMAVAMVLQQKLMPSTITDPVQKKIMLFMPLIFAVFMKDFPAGLTLYIVVSTLMGMAQQLFVYKRT